MGLVVHPLDRSMVLFNNIVEVFDLAYSDQYGAAGVNLVDRRLVRAAFIPRDLVRRAVRGYRFIEEALGCPHVALSRQ